MITDRETKLLHKLRKEMFGRQLARERRMEVLPAPHRCAGLGSCGNGTVCSDLTFRHGMCLNPNKRSYSFETKLPDIPPLRVHTSTLALDVPKPDIQKEVEEMNNA